MIDSVTDLPITEDQRQALQRALRSHFFKCLGSSPQPDLEEARNIKTVAAVLGFDEDTCPTGSLLSSAHRVELGYVPPDEVASR